MSAAYDIDALLSEVVTLPSLPGTVARLVQIVDDPNTSVADVSSLIAADPAISLKALRLVNSAYYGLRDRVRTVEHAVALLGVKVIKNMVLTATVFEVINTGVDAFTKHCVATGVAMRVLTRAQLPVSAHVDPEEAFLFGLLHDIGKVVLDEYLPNECAAVADLTQEAHCSWHEAELRVIGVGHGELGARLMEQWKLPDEFAQAIAGHHDLSVCPPGQTSLPATLAIANYIVSMCGIPSYDHPVFQLDGAWWEAAGISNEALPALLDAFFEEVPTIHSMMALALGENA